MKLHLLLLVVLCAFGLNSQTLTNTQEKIIKDILLEKFDAGVAKGTSFYQGLNSFAIIGKDTLFSVNGYHYLFRLNGDTLERLDKSVFHGGNFERYLYTYDGKIHLMGGYGLFNTNNNIEVFNPITREWGVIKTTGDKPPFIRGICLQKGHFIYSFFNSKSGNNVEDDLYDTNIYRLDLTNGNWTKFINVNTGALLIFDKLYTKNYSIGVMMNTVIIINNTNTNFIIIPREVLRLSLQQLFQYRIEGNSILFQNYLSTSENLVNYRVDVDSIWNMYQKSARPFILEPAFYQVPQYQMILLIAIVLCLLIGLYLYWKKRQVVKPNQTPELVNPLVQKLKLANKNTFDIDELDELLEINHMEFDSRKLKRHRLLSDLEKMHPGLIQRQKDETDKRRFIYVIKNAH